VKQFHFLSVEKGKIRFIWTVLSGHFQKYFPFSPQSEAEATPSSCCEDTVVKTATLWRILQ